MPSGPNLSFQAPRPGCSPPPWEGEEGERLAWCCEGHSSKGGVSWEGQHLDPDSGSGGAEWWDDRLHASSARTWDSLPPSKRKKAPLVSGILPPAAA